MLQASDGDGGALAVEKSLLTVNGQSAIYQNTASRDGGGIVLSSSSSAIFSASTIQNNSASDNGGGCAILEYEKCPLLSIVAFLDPGVLTPFSSLARQQFSKLVNSFRTLLLMAVVYTVVSAPL
jgi:hypothetical protein